MQEEASLKAMPIPKEEASLKAMHIQKEEASLKQQMKQKKLRRKMNFCGSFLYTLRDSNPRPTD